jgi:hypothetical protein
MQQFLSPAVGITNSVTYNGRGHMHFLNVCPNKGSTGMSELAWIYKYVTMVY